MFLNRQEADDKVLKQATVSNRTFDINTQEVTGNEKKYSPLAKPNEITFMFIPPLPNKKLIEFPNRSDQHPTFMLLWKE